MMHKLAPAKLKPSEERTEVPHEIADRYFVLGGL